jgi:acid phosphatase (class A)
VHWQSDVSEGLVVASTTIVRLHSNSSFRTDLEAAKAEIAAVRLKGVKLTHNCKTEADALAFIEKKACHDQ